jgi:hypothetical protein
MPFYIRCTLDCGDGLEWYRRNDGLGDMFVSTAERDEKACPFETAEAAAAFVKANFGRRRPGRPPKVPRVLPYEVVEVQGHQAKKKAGAG